MGTPCPKCNKVAEINNDTTILMHFRKQPWFDFIIIICCHCNLESRLFLGEHWVKELEQLQEGNIETISEDFAPDDLVESYMEIYEIEPLKEHELTKRLEQEIETLHEVLENIPDDLLWGIIETPEPPHDKPERWC